MVSDRDLERLDVDELMRRGLAAARVGENDEAQTYLTEVTRRDPNNADAWLWLGSVATNPVVKRDHFQHALTLRPGDAEAQAGLDRLAEKYGQAVLTSDEAVEVMYCTWHPDRETLLRCNRCGRPMCTACAVKHPVGLRCKECVREMRSPLYKVTPLGYVAGAVVAVAAGTVVAAIATFASFFGWWLWIVAFFVGAAVGAAIAEAVSIAAGRKRGRGLQLVTAAGMVIGVPLAGILMDMFGMPAVGMFGVQAGPLSLFLSPAVLIYLFVGIGAAMARLR
jgi:hypothetical protein